MIEFFQYENDSTEKLEQLLKAFKVHRDNFQEKINTIESILGQRDCNKVKEIQKITDRSKKEYYPARLKPQELKEEDLTNFLK